MIKYYILLAIAIGAETSAASMLTATKGFRVLKPSLICIISYAISFFAFGIALLKIDLGVAYATWGAVGMVVTSLAGYLFYKQKLTRAGMIGIIMVIISIMVLNLA